LSRTNLKVLLERGGYQVNEAGDGVAALHAIKAQMPDLVLTDLRMPIELITRLLGGRRAGDRPVAGT
jgi:CheY-like chemotaxis protein